jgi:hypothetical protein
MVSMSHEEMVKRMIEILLSEEPEHSFYASNTPKEYKYQRMMLTRD